MTTTLQAAYRRALDTEANRKSGLVIRLAARQLARALEDAQDDQAAEWAIQQLLAEWRQRESFSPAVAVIERILCREQVTA